MWLWCGTGGSEGTPALGNVLPLATPIPASPLKPLRPLPSVDEVEGVEVEEKEEQGGGRRRLGGHSFISIWWWGDVDSGGEGRERGKGSLG